MATTTTNKLEATFTCADGQKRTYIFADALAHEDIDVQDVSDMMDAMIANSQQFVKQPMVKVSANVVATSTTELDLSAAS